MNSKEEENINQDILMDDQRLAELAESTMALMRGNITRKLVKEYEKDNPDLEVIEQLKSEDSHLHDEAQQIFNGNKDMMRRCIDKYSPVLRAMISKNE